MFKASIIFLCACAMVLTQNVSRAQAVFADLGAKEFQAKLGSSPGAVLIDLRTPEEVRKGFIQGAKNLDYFGEAFEERLRALDRSTPCFLYCASGGRSEDALKIMKGLGFREVYNLESGIKGWVKSGLPLDLPKNP